MVGKSIVLAGRGGCAMRAHPEKNLLNPSVLDTMWSLGGSYDMSGNVYVSLPTILQQIRILCEVKGTIQKLTEADGTTEPPASARSVFRRRLSRMGC